MREDDQERVKPWALTLCNSFTEDDLAIFNKMKGPGTESRKTAARILQRRVLEIASELTPKAKSKTGPKTRDSHNQTDQEISVLYSVIRMILGLNKNAKIPDIHTELIKVLNDAQSYLTEHIRLTTIEARSIERNLQSWMDSKTSLPPWLSLQKACEQIKESQRGINSAQSKRTKQAKRTVNNHKSLKEKESENKRNRKEDEYFVELARALELHKDPMLDLEKAIIHEDREDNAIEYPKFESITELKLKRKGLLWSAIGRLTNLTTLFCDTPFEWTPTNLELLQNDIEITTMPFIRPRTIEPSGTVEPSVTVEPSANEIRLRELKRIISSASVRQGVSPFSDLLAGCKRKLQSPSIPGQIFK